MKIYFILFAACGLMAASFANAAVDADAAQAVLKKNGCMACHAVDKTKVGSSFKNVAKKYNGNKDAEAALIKHLTTKPMVDMGGNKTEHMVIKANDAELKNAVQWILSLK